MLTIEYPVTMTESAKAEDEAGIAEIKSGLSDFVNRVIYRDAVVWVTKNGRRVAGLAPIEVIEAGRAALAARDSADS